MAHLRPGDMAHETLPTEIHEHTFIFQANDESATTSLPSRESSIPEVGNWTMGKSDCVCRHFDIGGEIYLQFECGKDAISKRNETINAHLEREWSERRKLRAAGQLIENSTSHGKHCLQKNTFSNEEQDLEIMELPRNIKRTSIDRKVNHNTQKSIFELSSPKPTTSATNQSLLTVNSSTEGKKYSFNESSPVHFIAVEFRIKVHNATLRDADAEKIQTDNSDRRHLWGINATVAVASHHALSDLGDDAGAAIDRSEKLQRCYDQQLNNVRHVDIVGGDARQWARLFDGELSCFGDDVATLSIRDANLTHLSAVSLLAFDPSHPLSCLHHNVAQRTTQCYFTLSVTNSNVLSIEPGCFRTYKGCLEMLDLSGNSLNVIETETFSDLQELRILNLSGNALTGLDLKTFAGLTSLAVLDVSENSIAELLPERYKENKLSVDKADSSDGLEANAGNSYGQFSIDTNNGSSGKSHDSKVWLLAGLQSIDLSNNNLTRIKSLTFVDLFKVRVINVSYNFISELELDAFVTTSGNPHLSSFDVAEVSGPTSVQSSMLSTGYYILAAKCTRGWRSLETVDLSHNLLRKIRSDTLRGALCRVRRLLLSDNRIAHLPRYFVEHLPYLTQLDLSNNEITWLDVGALTSPSLISLNLSHNLLRKIVSMVFLYLPMIELIDLSSNYIGNVYKYAFYGMCNHSRGAVVNLRGNKLRTDSLWKILATFQHLESQACSVDVDMGDNSVSHLLGEALEFVQNQLTSRELERFEHWNRVSVRLLGNHIHCDCRLFEELKVLDEVFLAVNNATNSTCETLVDWMKLKCSHPQKYIGLTIESFRNSSNCTNRTTSIACPLYCSCTTTYEAVNCSSRRLHEFPKYHSGSSTSSYDLGNESIKGLSLGRWISLDLSSNLLRTIRIVILRQLLHVKELYLHNNRIVTLPSYITMLPELRLLTLHGNPIHCQCSIAWLYGLSVGSVRLVNDWEKIRCDDGTLIQNSTIFQDCDDTAMSYLRDENVFITGHTTNIARWSAGISFIATFIFLLLALSIVTHVLPKLRRNVGRCVDGGTTRTTKNSNTSWKRLGITDDSLSHGRDREVLRRTDVHVIHGVSTEHWVQHELLSVLQRYLPVKCNVRFHRTTTTTTVASNDIITENCANGLSFSERLEPVCNCDCTIFVVSNDVQMWQSSRSKMKAVDESPQIFGRLIVLTSFDADSINPEWFWSLTDSSSILVIDRDDKRFYDKLSNELFSVAVASAEAGNARLHKNVNHTLDLTNVIVLDRY